MRTAITLAAWTWMTRGIKSEISFTMFVFLILSVLSALVKDLQVFIK